MSLSHCNKELESSGNYPLSFPKGILLNLQLLYTWVAQAEPGRTVELKASGFLYEGISVTHWLFGEGSLGAGAGPLPR